MADLETKDRAKLKRLITKYGLSQIGPWIEGHARATILLRLAGEEKRRSTGGSRIGGTPDLPKDLDWPHVKKQPLHFIAQIDLADLPRWNDDPLPKRGRLYFFLGNDEPAYHIVNQVIYSAADAKSLREVSPPNARQRAGNSDAAEDEDWDDEDEDDDYFGQFKPHRLKAHWSICLPSNASRVYLDYMLGLKLDDQTLTALGEGYSKLDDELDAVGVRGKRRKFSRLLGHPKGYVGNPDEDARKHMSPKKSREEWTLLLDVASHFPVGMNWWDAGRLLFLIRRAELEKKDFTRTYACVETS
jgi:uncharacterized protein YwqG